MIKKKWLIGIKESEMVELKSSLSQINEIMETVSAFANTDGGKIIIGVSNSGRILGVEIGKDTVERLTNKIRQEIDPKIHPRVNIESAGQKNVIIIDVKPVLDKLVLAFGRPFKRIGRSTVRMTKDEYEGLILEKHKDELQYDKLLCKGLHLKDIDDEKVKWFLKEAKKYRGLKIPEDTRLHDVLRRLGLLREGKLTNAAALLFGKEHRLIQAEVKCIRFKGNEPVKPYIDFQTLTGNAFDLADQALDFVLRNIKKSVWLVSARVQREEKYEYPPEAIREAIVNAIVHRDYFSPSKVQVRVFDDYLEIWNPGKLPKGWTVEKLKHKHESVPRNPLLFKQFFWVKYVEDVGGGTLDILSECKKWGITEPEFEDTGTSLIVTLRKSKLTDDYLASLGLNKRQINTIMNLRETKEKITNKEYRNAAQISDEAARVDLNELVSRGILKSKGKGRGAYYELIK